MTDEVDAQIPAVAHAVEDPAERRDVLRRDLGHARLEPYGGHDVPQLDRLELLPRDLLDFQPVAALLIEFGGILCPARERLVIREVALRRLQDRFLDRSDRASAGTRHAASISSERWLFMVFTCPPARVSRAAWADHRAARRSPARWSAGSSSSSRSRPR